MLCLILAGIGLLAGAGAPDATAHVVMGTKSLHLRIVETDLVLRAKVVDPDAEFVSTDGRSRRELVEIEVLEVLKGKAGAQRIRFAQDGHEPARYRGGQQALFFLAAIERSRELRALAVEGGPSHYSSQEHDEVFSLDGPQAEVLLSATRQLIASESAETTARRVALIREATLAQLTSGDSQLGASGLASLVLSPQAALVTRADLPRLEKLLADPEASIGLRAGLLSELERRGLVAGPEQWRQLLESASPADLPAAMRAAGGHPSPTVRAFLLGVLESPESSAENAAEAAIALGGTSDPSVIKALLGALEHGGPRLRHAAIRALGQIDTPQSIEGLRTAAAGHADPATRRRAAAEVRSRSLR